MPRTKGSRDISPNVLAAFIRAEARMASRGADLATMLEEAIEEHGILKVLDVVHKFNPKQQNIDIDQKVAFDTTALSEDMIRSAMHAKRELEEAAESRTDSSLH